MRRTNKRNNLKKRRKTLKKRFSKRGGVQEECGVCKNYFHMLGTIGAPSRRDDPNLYQNHIKTHPICAYCKGEFLDNNTLANHLQNIHPDKYKLAESIKYGINNESNLIDKLKENDWSNIGSLPELTTFYDKIKAKQESIEKKNSIRLEKEAKDKAAKAKMLAKETTRKEALARATAKLAEEEAKKESERLAKEADKERQAEIRAKKQEQKEREQKENLARDLEVKTMGSEDKLAKGIEKNIRKEQKLMGEGVGVIVEEDFAAAIAATTVEDVEEIIESASEPIKHTISTVPIQNIDLRSMLSRDEIRIIKSANFQRDITYNMTSLFPVIKCFSEEINKLTNKETKFNNYKFINNLILFLVGLFNYKFIQNNIDIRMIIKGGKGAQMILSLYDFYNINISNKNKVKCDIVSDDIDILLIQENGYNRETLYSVAKQFAEFIKNFVDEPYTSNPLVSIKEPIPDAFNPNIFKISYKTSEKYIIVSDIDFKQVETEYFNINNLEGIGFPNEYDPYGLQYSYGNYIFNLRYLLQSPQTFLAEKQHYLSIYENIIQKSSTIKDKECNCETDKTENKTNSKDFDYDCHITCKFRKMMIPKFQKYIDPFQQLLDRLSNNSAEHY